MGLDSQAELINRIRNESRYRAEIERLLPGTANSDRVDAIAEALTTYVRSLRKGSNLYDHFVSLHDPNALTPGQQHGLALFRGAAGCAECHQLTGSPAMFTDDTFHSTLISPHIAPLLPEAAIEIVNADLDTTTLNARIESDATMSALGRFVVTHDPKDIGAFRTPSLRNVAETAPYMHDGSVRTLREAVDQEIYYRNLQTNRPNTLTEQDRRDLVAFLESLTDARLSAPKERPPP
jgi:cytochrome c peroxidase